MAYYSWATSACEQVYPKLLETLALMESAKHFGVYQMGIYFKVVTECSAVRASLTKRNLVPRIARWCLAIHEFDMEVEYKSEKRLLHFDALSRNPTQHQEEKDRHWGVANVYLTSIGRENRAIAGPQSESVDCGSDNGCFWYLC